MATELLKSIVTRGNHDVGNLNKGKVETISHGAVLLEDVDNFHLVELGFNAEGERTAKYLTDETKQGYLIASPEERYMNEPLTSFYNGTGERGRIVILKEGLRFDTSAFELDTVGGVTALSEGQFASYDPATKKFKVTTAESITAKNTFLVVGEGHSLSGKDLVRLEVIK